MMLISRSSLSSGADTIEEGVDLQGKDEEIDNHLFLCCFIVQIFLHVSTVVQAVIKHGFSPLLA